MDAGHLKATRLANDSEGNLAMVHIEGRAFVSNAILERECADRDREIERLRGGLDAAIRAAKLALFVIRKQDVMPNSSWESGFNGDLATAEAARVPLKT